MSIDLKTMRPGKLAGLLNSTRLGEVTSETRVRRNIVRAGLRVGDSTRVNVLGYAAWLVAAWHARRGPGSAGGLAGYDALRASSAARNRRLSAAGRDIAPLPVAVRAARPAGVGRAGPPAEAAGDCSGAGEDGQARCGDAGEAPAGGPGAAGVHPAARYQTLRELARARARLSHAATAAMCQVHSLLRAANVHPPFKRVFGPRGRRWLAGLDLGESARFVRDELLRRLEHFRREMKALDEHLDEMAGRFPETAALEVLYGIGRYSALLIVAELGEPERFQHRGQVGAYAGLTSRVHQSGGHDYHGSISKQGSGWLRWVLGQAAIKIVRQDRRLQNFYTRVRKRSGRNKARVAVARKLAEICWVRLRRWHREQAAPKA